jgi:hypothetical protein
VNSITNLHHRVPEPRRSIPHPSSSKTGKNQNCRGKGEILQRKEETTNLDQTGVQKRWEKSELKGTEALEP